MRRSRTVVSSPAMPTSWRITPTWPSIEMVPDVGWISPLSRRRTVVLPTPLAPTSATRSPSPTWNDTSSSRVAPPGRRHPRWLTWMDPTSGRGYVHPSAERAGVCARARETATAVAARGSGLYALGTQERCQSGRMGRPAKALTVVRRSVGSNPTLSARRSRCRTAAAAGTSGRSPGGRPVLANVAFS